MKVLITGASGFVGQHLWRTMQLDSSWQITLLDRHELVDLPTGVRMWIADILDPQSLPEESFDAVVHLAAMLPHKEKSPEIMHQVNVEGTRHLVQKYGKGQTHFVLFSTAMLYYPPLDAYAQSKWEAENIVHTHILHGTALRPAVIYGLGAPAGMFLGDMLQALHRQQLFPMTAGEQLRDFIHIDDVVEAVLCILRRRVVGTLALASGEAVHLYEVADLAEQISGRTGYLQRGAIPYREKESFAYAPDASTLSTVANWQPQRTLKQGMQQIWNQLQGVTHV